MENLAIAHGTTLVLNLDHLKRIRVATVPSAICATCRHSARKQKSIRSERALCRDVQVNLAYRWFCGLSIEDKVPDHSAFSRARNERFRESDIFRRVFEHVVQTCIAAGLVGGEGFAVDASLIAADANKQRSIPGAE